MHRKTINRRTEIGNVCVSLLYFLQTFHFLLSLLHGESEFLLKVILSNKGFHQQICFPKNGVWGVVEQLLTEWHFTVLSGAASQAVAPKLKDHFKCSMRLHPLPATVKIKTEVKKEN